MQSAGYEEINLNVGELTSGVYFYQLQTTEFSDIKKLVIVK